MRLMESANSCRSAGSTLLLLPQMRRLCQSPVGDCVARAMFFTGWLGKVTPRLFLHRYDEGYFMAIAAADIVGGMFVFGAVAVTFALFSGTFAVRLLDFFLLLGILIVALRMSYRSFYARRGAKAQHVS